MEDRYVPPDVVAERFDRLCEVVGRSGLRRYQDRVGRTRGGARRGAEPARPDRADRPDAAGQARPLRPARRRRAGDRVVRRGRGDRCGAAPPDRPVRTADRARRDTGRASPSPPADADPPVTAGRAPDRRPVVLLGTTASGKSDVAMAVARRRGDVELVCIDSMTVYRGMDIGTAKPSAGRPGRGAAPPPRPRRPVRRVHGGRVPGGRPGRVGRHRRARPAGRPRRRHRPLPAIGRRRPRPPRSLAGGRGRARTPRPTSPAASPPSTPGWPRSTRSPRRGRRRRTGAASSGRSR